MACSLWRSNKNLGVGCVAAMFLFGSSGCEDPDLYARGKVEEVGGVEDVGFWSPPCINEVLLHRHQVPGATCQRGANGVWPQGLRRNLLLRCSQDVHQQLVDKDEEIEELKAT